MNKFSSIPTDLNADCEKCFALCCVALPFAKSADFNINKDGGIPCKNLQVNFRCEIHSSLRSDGFKGCTVFECFGAGQKVSQITYEGRDWRNHANMAEEMFAVFPIMQQLHEMLFYLHEAYHHLECQKEKEHLQNVIDETTRLTNLRAEDIMRLNLSVHRMKVNSFLLKASEYVRERYVKKRTGKANIMNKGTDLMEAKLRGLDLRGSNMRGAFLIAADLRDSDLRGSDFIGADLRDADVRSANLSDSIFLTQLQINSAKGDAQTVLPKYLRRPVHWI
ncbi:pentapeptide repeat-containing protein [Cytobacillus spongiae]|uniref:pentapeptide repeat-containing protein n=1 Tax=Cytobacillus spongiae TaxID=2901381 RepID=UPI001F199811|nr:pentapeptide repeat-containing protein [Cytobacillus spongiae]UII57909.1 pentapeptide repeat-containing protein [Cytobacillus spongiae]